MAAIGKIRKHGVFLLVIIGVALLAFLLGDLSSVTTVFAKKNMMAKAGRVRLDKTYSEQYEQNTALMRYIQNKTSFTEDETYQIHEITWRQMLQELALDKELKALGLAYTPQMEEDFKAEMIASLRTQQPNQFIMQFANSLAQVYGADNVPAILDEIDGYKDVDNQQVHELYQAYRALCRMAVSAEKASRYMAMVQNGIYFSDPMAEKLAAENATALVSLMVVNPDAPAFNDLTPDIRKNDLRKFYKTHKHDLFDVHEQNRDIDVAVFPILPTPQDLKDIEDSVRRDFARFSTVSMLEYATEKGHGMVDSTYFKNEDVNLEILDSLIFKSPVGTYIEPFEYEGGKWFFGKVFGAAERPDSVQVAYIPLPFKTGVNTSAPMTKKEARRAADSLTGVIVSGTSSIFKLRKSYLNNDRQKNDSTLWIPERAANMEPALYNGLLAAPIGGVYVHTFPDGLMLYQVLAKTAPVAKRQFVVYDYDILASDATVSAIKTKAVGFASSVTTADELVDEAARQGIQAIRGTEVLPMASAIGQLNSCRDIVSWAFNDDIKENAISDVMNINRNFFTVAAVRTIRNTGVAKFKNVEKDIETMVKTEKKTEMVTDRINSALASSDMKKLAADYGTRVTDSVRLTFKGNIYQNRNVESMAIGKIFSLEKNKPAAVSGKEQVYVVNVRDITRNEKNPNLFMEKNVIRNAVTGRDRNEMTLMQYLIDEMHVYDNRCRFYQK